MFITVTDAGAIRVSPSLYHLIASNSAWVPSFRVAAIRAEHRAWLEWHRRKVFKVQHANE